MAKESIWTGQRRPAWLVTLCGILLASIATADNWPRFRGPNGQGVSDARTVPTKWSEQDYNWRIELPGTGHSSPVAWDGKLFVTCADQKAGRGMLLCIDSADGAQRWRAEQDLRKYPLNSLNSYAGPTPAVDDEHVYVLWPDDRQTVLLALTHEGGHVWTVPLAGVHTRHGQGSSPIVCGPYVIVSHEQERNNDGVTSQWLAIDRRTGEVKWRREEPGVVNASYSTPCTYEDSEGRLQLVFAGNAHGITGVDMETGDVVWQVDSALPARVVGSPVVAGDLVIGTCGEGGRGLRLAAVRPIREGSSYRAAEVYSLDSRVVPYVPTSVAYEGMLFAFHDSGVVSCLMSETGRVVWSEKPAGRFFGSPICVNGNLYALTVDGDVVVLAAGPEYKLLGVNPLGEKSHATPAVADGRLILRTFSHLVSIGGPSN